MTKLIAVVGPTGTGKSDTAIAVAKHIESLGQKAEIVNADSMQFYRGMNIGTAKLSEVERQGVEHHLLDWLDIADESTAAEYQLVARRKILELQEANITPILAGGSMLYLAAALNEFGFAARDETIRAELEAELLRVGESELYRRLVALAPDTASRIDPKNGRRIVRALEVVSITGDDFAAKLPDLNESWQPVLEIGLNSDRAHLVARLQTRATSMWQRGLVAEVEALIPVGIRDGKTSSRAIGYAQALAQLDGRLTEAEAIEETAKLTSRYARRQMSWFRRDPRINWFDYQDPQTTSNILNLVTEHLNA
ncbi:MAG: tRNA (adenosine(37)-N6)-dimethylallyltransferase MiaA [Actinobacteria bacterium]|uniref:tRNA dimethylallyltransferase n=1 Tax=freshwater metagenome TaxID=449393 RepID=A0A6J6GXC3_9ZZZZ|nr:tRNA (adenosine(37)-N6)-dimethylallyltransferase MiaA [Actinomycetota bacterium]